MRRTFFAAFVVAVAVASAPVWAQRTPIGVARQPLGDGPFLVDTAEQHKLRVVVVTKGLVKPWSMAFLPDGSMLVTELQRASCGCCGTACSTRRRWPACRSQPRCRSAA